MRQTQIGVFVLGVVSFLAAAFFIGEDTADTLWRIGVAATLIDMVFVRLWPSAKP